MDKSLQSELFRLAALATDNDLQLAATFIVSQIQPVKKPVSQLRILADEIENNPAFDQKLTTHCIVGLGSKRFGSNSANTRLFAKSYGVTVQDAKRLLLAYFRDLNIGEEDMPLQKVTNTIAARVLRKLAERNGE